MDSGYQYLQSNDEYIVSKNQSNQDVLAKRQAESYLKKCYASAGAAGKKLKESTTFDNELRYRFIARTISDEKNMQNIFTMFEDETGKRIICPGDMELPQELMLLYNKEKIDLGCNVLVIGHHELLTSSFVSYLERVAEDSKQKGINPEEILVVSFTGGDDLNKIETREYKDTGTVNAKLYQTGFTPVNRTYKNHIQLIRDENLNFRVVEESKINEYIRKKDFKNLEEYIEKGGNLTDFLKEHKSQGYEGAEHSDYYEHEQALEERGLNIKGSLREELYEAKMKTKELLDKTENIRKKYGKKSQKYDKILSQYVRALQKEWKLKDENEKLIKLEETKNSIKENMEGQRELEKTYEQKLKEESEKLRELEEDKEQKYNTHER